MKKVALLKIFSLFLILNFTSLSWAKEGDVTWDSTIEAIKKLRKDSDVWPGSEIKLPKNKTDALRSIDHLLKKRKEGSHLSLSNEISLEVWKEWLENRLDLFIGEFKKSEADRAGEELLISAYDRLTDKEIVELLGQKDDLDVKIVNKIFNWKIKDLKDASTGINKKVSKIFYDFKKIYDHKKVKNVKKNLLEKNLIQSLKNLIQSLMSEILNKDNFYPVDVLLRNLAYNLKILGPPFYITAMRAINLLDAPSENDYAIFGSKEFKKLESFLNSKECASEDKECKAEKLTSEVALIRAEKGLDLNFFNKVFDLPDYEGVYLPLIEPSAEKLKGKFDEIKKDLVKKLVKLYLSKPLNLEEATGISNFYFLDGMKALAKRYLGDDNKKYFQNLEDLNLASKESGLTSIHELGEVERDKYLSYLMGIGEFGFVCKLLHFLKSKKKKLSAARIYRFSYLAQEDVKDLVSGIELDGMDDSEVLSMFLLGKELKKADDREGDKTCSKFGSFADWIEYLYKGVVKSSFEERLEYLSKKIATKTGEGVNVSDYLEGVLKKNRNNHLRGLLWKSLFEEWEASKKNRVKAVKGLIREVWDKIENKKSLSNADIEQKIIKVLESYDKLTEDEKAAVGLDNENKFTEDEKNWLKIQLKLKGYLDNKDDKQKLGLANDLVVEYEKVTTKNIEKYLTNYNLRNVALAYWVVLEKQEVCEQGKPKLVAVYEEILKIENLIELTKSEGEKKSLDYTSNMVELEKIYINIINVYLMNNSNCHSKNHFKTVLEGAESAMGYLEKLTLQENLYFKVENKLSSHLFMISSFDKLKYFENAILIWKKALKYMNSKEAKNRIDKIAKADFKGKIENYLRKLLIKLLDKYEQKAYVEVENDPEIQSEYKYKLSDKDWRTIAQLQREYKRDSIEIVKTLERIEVKSTEELWEIIKRLLMLVSNFSIEDSFERIDGHLQELENLQEKNAESLRILMSLKTAYISALFGLYLVPKSTSGVKISVDLQYLKNKIISQYSEISEQFKKITKENKNNSKDIAFFISLSSLLQEKEIINLLSNVQQENQKLILEVFSKLNIETYQNPENYFKLIKSAVEKYENIFVEGMDPKDEPKVTSIWVFFGTVIPLTLKLFEEHLVEEEDAKEVFRRDMTFIYKLFSKAYVSSATDENYKEEIKGKLGSILSVFEINEKIIDDFGEIVKKIKGILNK